MANTYLRSETSLPRKLITVDVKMKLENTVKSPAIPAVVKKTREKKRLKRLYCSVPPGSEDEQAVVIEL